MYNYLESVKNSVKNYLIENDYNIEEVNKDDLHDLLWCEDSITGNGSGSYTFNTYKAQENLNGNWGLLEECASEFGIEPTISDGWEHGAEWWDVSIRCYLLSQAIDEVINEWC